MQSQLDYRLTSLHPRLSDWTTVGYQQGAPPPNRPATISFPAGITTLTIPLKLLSGAVVKGQGRDQTILRCPSLLDVLGRGSWFAGGKTDAPGWSTGGGWLTASGVSEIGIEDLTIEFPAHTAEPHFYEVGYNAVFFSAVTHAWLRNVRFVNTDGGVLAYKSSQITLENVEITHPHTTPNSEHHVGHYGVMFGRDCHHWLVDGLRVTHLIRHDTDVANGANHNVVMRSAFKDYACSHHGGNPHHNLFTDINAGAGTRFWFSGGGFSAMPHNGAGEVFWNVRKADGTPLGSLPPFSGSKYWRKDLAIIGHTQNRLNTDLTKEWVEGIHPVDPSNLSLAQRGEESVPTPVPLPVPVPPEDAMAFMPGDTVRTLEGVNVRQQPALASTLLGTQPPNVTAVILEGPTKDPNSPWTYCRLDFGNGVDGWVGTNKLRQ